MPKADVHHAIPSVQPTPRTKRLQIDLYPDDVLRLAEAKTLAGEKTNTDAIRRALRFYRWALDKDEQGFTFQMVREGKVVEVALL